jgi:hypothetical protein
MPLALTLYYKVHGFAKYMASEKRALSRVAQLSGRYSRDIKRRLLGVERLAQMNGNLFEQGKRA